MQFVDACDTSLGLGFGCHVTQHSFSRSDRREKIIKNGDDNNKEESNSFACPLLRLGLSISDDRIYRPNEESSKKISYLDGGSVSFSNSSSVKKEIKSDDCYRVSHDDYEDEEGSPRKKLRLTKEQSVVLEDIFKQQSTLNPKQKQALAEQLNLRPRQVEVWFQNRRARTKVKQTEVDYELLKRSCETLKEENKRLQKELQELRSLDQTVPYYMQFPVAALAMCPSCCERLGGGADATDGSSSGTTFTDSGPKAQFYIHPFSYPFAAC